MNIAISGRHILPRMEGIGRYSKEIIMHLVTSHPEDEFHILLDRNYQPDWLKQLDATVHIVHPQARHPILWYLWYEWGLPTILNKIQPDVLFCPEGYLSKKTKVPTVMTVHDLAFKHFSEGSYPSHIRYLQKNTGSFIKRADHLVCVSSFTEQDLMSHYPYAVGKTSVIGHGVDESFVPISSARQDRVREELTGGTPYFLYLGSMHPRKNITRLIEAFEMYMEERHAPKYLVLAGRLAWKSDSIKRKIETSSYRDYIIYGSDLEVNIPELIGSAEVLCYVSLFEGFGLPALEAMACGIPVITSRDSAMSEVCGDAALYVNPEDPAEIKNGMVQQQTDPELRQKLAKLGVDRASSFRWSEAAERVYDVLSQV